MPGRRRTTSLALLASVAALAGCGDDDSQPEPPGLVDYGDQVIYARGQTVHFEDGDREVTLDEHVGSLHYSTAGLVVELLPGDPDGPMSEYLLLREDGSTKELDLPEFAALDTDPEQPYLAYKAPEEIGRGRVLDLRTNKLVADLEVANEDYQNSLTLEGDTLWMHHSEYADTYRVNWRSGESEKIPVAFVRGVAGDYATVVGGDENDVDNELEKPGIVDLSTGAMVARGTWRLSPDARYAVSERASSDTLTTLHVRDMESGKVVTHQATYPKGDVLDWAWTADGSRLFWFEGEKLVVCEGVADDCSTRAAGGADSLPE